MTHPNHPPQPGEPHPDSRISARARRRRARRELLPKDTQGRAAVVAALAKRSFPSYELFMYSLFCGAVLGVGFFIDSFSVLVLGILIAPLMAPVVGLVLSIISGLPRLFIQTMAGLLISVLLVFATSALAGLASRLFLPRTFNAAFTLSRLWYPDLVVLGVGMVLLTISFVRSESKPYLPSAIVAFEVFIPLSASAFGVGNGVGDLWPHGLFVFAVHLCLAIIYGLVTLVLLRFRPLSNRGYFFTISIFIIVLILIFIIIDPTRSKEAEFSHGTATPTAVHTNTALLDAEPLAAPSLTATSMTSSPTDTKSSPEDTPEESTTVVEETVSPVPLTLEVTLPLTETRTITPAPEPTPIYAVIRAREGGGAYIRKEPGGNVLATLDNGEIVQILPDTQDLNGALWVNVIVTRNDIRVEGWMIQTVLETATPIPNWEPSETPTP